MTGTRLIIIGAGPGGIAAALACRRVGIAAVVYERGASDRSAGSALTLWPNATQALEAMGLAAAIRSIVLPLEGIEMRSSRGERLFEMPMAGSGDSACWFACALPREQLMNEMLKKLDNGVVHYGANCIDICQSDAGVTARFDGGREETGDLLVGADGLQSMVRERLFDHRPPRYAGYTVWRGVAHFDMGHRIGSMSAGAGAQFGVFPMARGQTYWFASAIAPEGERDEPAGPKRRLLRMFANWHEPVCALVAATDNRNILRNDAYDRDPLTQWHRGRVALMGDAAHPATPTLGQGACQAIEDAIVLAKCLAKSEDVDTGLRLYETHRLERTTSMTLNARRVGEMACWQRPVACWIRNTIMKLTPGFVRNNQLRRMFEFHP